jgi:hypothetical protein
MSEITVYLFKCCSVGLVPSKKTTASPPAALCGFERKIEAESEALWLSWRVVSRLCHTHYFSISHKRLTAFVTFVRLIAEGPAEWMNPLGALHTAELVSLERNLSKSQSDEQNSNQSLSGTRVHMGRVLAKRVDEFVNRGDGN